MNHIYGHQILNHLICPIPLNLRLKIMHFFVSSIKSSMLCLHLQRKPAEYWLIHETNSSSCEQLFGYLGM